MSNTLGDYTLKFWKFRYQYEVVKRTRAVASGVLSQYHDKWVFRPYDNWQPTANEMIEIEAKLNELNSKVW